MAKVDRLGREIPVDGMVSPDGDDRAAHERMLQSWRDSPYGVDGPPVDPENVNR